MVEPSASPEPMELEAAAEEASSSLQVLTVEVLGTIKAAQAQNGLKHGDYMRYRRHCSSRVQSLYKVLKLQHGRTKYVKRKLEPQTCTDPRHLLIPLFNAERAWAYGMELKKQLEKAMEPRKRNHMIRRLAKAVWWAGELARLAASRCDTRAALEAEAYACIMAGHLGLEKEQDWKLTLARYTRAKKLLEELSKVGSLEAQALCLAGVEELEPSLRYCTYQIGRAGGQVPETAALLTMAEQEGRAGLEQLSSQLASLAQEAAVAQAAATSSLEWPSGTHHPVRAEKVKLAIQAANALYEQLESLQDTAMDVSTAGAEDDAAAAAASGPSSSDAKVSLYDKMISALSDARAHVRNAQKSVSGADAEAQYAELAALEQALTGMALQRAVERGGVQVSATRARFQAGLAKLATGKKLKDNRSFARGEDVVRVLESQLHGLEELSDMGARLGGRQGEQLHEQAGAQVAAARALRAYHLAHAYLAASDKAREAAAMFHRTVERCQQACERVEELPAADQHAHVDMVSDMKAVQQQARAYLALAQAEAAAASVKAAEEVAGGVGSLGLSEQQQQQAGTRYLADSLESWESFAGAQGRPARLIKPPFTFQAVPVRPIMLDTASAAIDYPSLDTRVPKSDKKAAAAAGSMLSSLFGWKR